MIRCIVVEDEPAARKVLLRFIEDAPGIKLENAFSNALEAGEYLKNNHVDLIFLDINMPMLDGISFLKSLKNHH